MTQTGATSFAAMRCSTEVHSMRSPSARRLTPWSEPDSRSRSHASMRCVNRRKNARKHSRNLPVNARDLRMPSPPILAQDPYCSTSQKMRCSTDSHKARLMQSARSASPRKLTSISPCNSRASPSRSLGARERCWGLHQSAAKISSRTIANSARRHLKHSRSH